jgi:iron(III) transport system substrate-binding protein
VVLYTSMPDAIVNQLEGVFEGAFPDFQGNVWIQPGADNAGGITLEVVRGRTADIQALVAAEIAAGSMRADVIWLAEPSTFEIYKDERLVAPYSPPADTPLLAEFVDPDGFYVAGRIMAMVLAWDPDQVPEGLADWTDLLWQERSAFPSPASGAARATIKALVDQFGQDFFTTLRTMGGESVASNGAARNGLLDGDYAAVAVLDYMARQAMANGASIDFAYPASGTVVMPSPLAITVDAANPEAAKVFVDYVLSQTGQEIVVELGSFYPVREDVDPPPGAPTLDSISVLPVDWRALSDEIALIDALWSLIYGSGADE